MAIFFLVDLPIKQSALIVGAMKTIGDQFHSGLSRIIYVVFVLALIQNIWNLLLTEKIYFVEMDYLLRTHGKRIVAMDIPLLRKILIFIHIPVPTNESVKYAPKVRQNDDDDF